MEPREGMLDVLLAGCPACHDELNTIMIESWGILVRCHKCSAAFEIFPHRRRGWYVMQELPRRKDGLA